MGSIAMRGARSGCPAASILLALAGCATSAQSPAPISPPATGVPLPDTSEEDRALLSQLTEQLGEGLPAPAPDDPVGIEEPRFQTTRMFLPGARRLHHREVRVRATAFKNRMSQMEVTFPSGCPGPCATSLEQTLKGWIGPGHVFEEGRARFVTYDFDTTRLRLEVFAARPDLVRLLIECRPLAAAANGRALNLGTVGVRTTRDPRPPCRPLAP